MPLKPKFKIAFLILAVLFLGWNAFQPGGWLNTFQQNLWSIDLLKQLNSSDQIDQIQVPEISPHSAVLLARKALKDEQPYLAREILSSLLENQDRAVQGTNAEVLFANGQQTEAIKIWESLNETILLERAANNSTQPGDEQSLLAANQALYRLEPEKYASSLALTLKSLGRSAETEQLLQLSRSEYPESEYASNWLRYLADIYVDTGDWLKAEQVYLQTIQEDPDDIRVWRNLGLLYNSHLNSPEKAVECFQEMIQLSPGDSYGYLLLAQTYEKTNDLEKALYAYKSLLTIDPDNDTALQAVERLSVNGE